MDKLIPSSEDPKKNKDAKFRLNKKLLEPLKKRITGVMKVLQRSRALEDLPDPKENQPNCRIDDPTDNLSFHEAIFLSLLHWIAFEYLLKTMCQACKFVQKMDPSRPNPWTEFWNVPHQEK